MRFQWRSARTVIVLLLLLGCGGDHGPSSPMLTDPGSRDPHPGYMEIVPDTMVLELGGGGNFVAWVHQYIGMVVQETPAWHSTGVEWDIVKVDETTGAVVAVAPGTTQVVATTDHYTARATVIVRPPPSTGGSDALNVAAFSLLEYKYSPTDFHWYYAPQLSVTGSDGGAMVLAVQFHLASGFGDPPPWQCGGVVSGNGVTANLNGELYGDWAWSFDRADGRRAMDSTVSATITYLDEHGVMATILANGPIVPGSLPDTYSGGANGGVCAPP